MSHLGERFPLLLETNNAFRIVTKTHFNSEHTIDFCVVSLHGMVKNQEEVSQAYKTSVSKKQLHTKRTTFPFVVRNEQHFKNLHGVVGNKERFSDKKFLNVIAYLQSEIPIFLVFFSSGDLTFFFRATLQKFRAGFGRHDFGRDDSRAT